MFMTDQGEVLAVYYRRLASSEVPVYCPEGSSLLSCVGVVVCLCVCVFFYLVSVVCFVVGLWHSEW